MFQKGKPKGIWIFITFIYNLKVEAIAFWVTNELLPIHLLTLECRLESLSCIYDRG